MHLMNIIEHQQDPIEIHGKLLNEHINVRYIWNNEQRDIADTVKKCVEFYKDYFKSYNL